MTKQALESMMRNDCLAALQPAIESKYDISPLQVATGTVAIPTTDSDGNEVTILVKVSIARGTRGAEGYTPYDAYAAEAEYRFECEERAAKKTAAAEKKAAKIAADEKRRAEKAAAKA